MDAPALLTWVDIPRHGDGRGQLAVMELGGALPFAVRRVYWLHGTQPGVRRGHHAHRRLRQLLICVAGSVRVELWDGHREETALLGPTSPALSIGPGLWRELSDFSPDCVLMVLADAEYDEADYIRDREEFVRHVAS